MKITKILTFFLITISFMYASVVLTVDHSPFKTTYQTMSTIQLQLEVEKRSLTGDLPFDMGLELMNRWSQQ